MMATPPGLLQQFQIPVPSFIETLETSFVDDFIKVATVIAIIGIAASIFAAAPVLGVFSGLMLGVCLIAKSALEDAAGKAIAETALKTSQKAVEQAQKDLDALKITLANIEATEPQNAALIASLEAKIAEQETEIEKLKASEDKLKQELQEANALAEQISLRSVQFRNAITKLQTENEKLQTENTDLKNKLVQPVKEESKKGGGMFGFTRK